MSGIHQATAQPGERTRIAVGTIRRDDKSHEPFFLGWQILCAAPTTHLWHGKVRCSFTAATRIQIRRIQKKPLSKHPHVEVERFGFAEFDFGEIGMGRVQQNVPFAGNRGRGNQQRFSFFGADPFVAEAAQ